eukprot:scaffold175600_cov25-Attheya_sp.AAC.1
MAWLRRPGCDSLVFLSLCSGLCRAAQFIPNQGDVYENSTMRHNQGPAYVLSSFNLRHRKDLPMSRVWANSGHRKV